MSNAKVLTKNGKKKDIYNYQQKETGEIWRANHEERRLGNLILTGYIESKLDRAK